MIRGSYTNRDYVDLYRFQREDHIYMNVFWGKDKRDIKYTLIKHITKDGNHQKNKKSKVGQ